MRRKIKQLEKIKVGIVNYLNTKPLLYGINQSAIRDSIMLVQDYPSNIASFLQEGKIDIGLVPVAILPQMKEYYIHTDYCIGCDGAVASVCLFSEVPINEVKTVLLDYQSKTSVALLKVLLRDFWQVEPHLVNTSSDYSNDIQGTIAGLVIGDRSFKQRKISTYAYDLGEAWKQFTGLPFVFASWVSKKVLDPRFVADFNAANAAGVSNLPAVLESVSYPLFNLEEYFTSYISYPFDAQKKKGLRRFMELLSREPILR